MRVLVTLALAISAVAAVDQGAQARDRTDVLGLTLFRNEATYDLLKYYYKYASSAYPSPQPCPHPSGQTLVSSVRMQNIAQAFATHAVLSVARSSATQQLAPVDSSRAMTSKKHS